MSISTKVTPDEAPIPGKRPCMPTGIIRGEDSYRRRKWLKAPPGVTKEDLLYEGFWKNVCKQFVRHDIITVLADDESWEAELAVEAVRHDGAEVSMRKIYSRKPIASTSMTALGDDQEFHTAWRPGLSWCVIRRKDDFAVERGHSSEGAAIMAWQRAQPRKVA